MIGSDLDNVRELFGERYRVEAKLPWNGLTFMYRARRQSKPVVLAVLPVDCGSSRMTARLFEEGAEKLLCLEDPGLVRVLGYGIQQDIPFLELERVGGFPMANAPAPGADASIPGRRAVRIVQQVLQALKSAHASGVLHLDVTPANVLVEGERTRLLGTGIASLLVAMRDDTATGPTGRGSGPQAGRYLAPEVRVGDPASEGADVYSAGALLYRFVSGELPPSPGTGLGTVPNRLVPIITTAMARAPEDRFASAESFWTALEIMLNEVDEADLAKAERKVAARAVTLRPAPRRPKHLLWVGGATVVAAGVVAVGAALGSAGGDPSTGSTHLTSAPHSALGPLNSEPAKATERGQGEPDRTGSDSAQAPDPTRDDATPNVGTGPTRETGATSGRTGRRDLLTGDLPYPLAALRESLDASAIGAGPRLDRSSLAPAARWTLAHPEDPRGHLALAEAYMRLGWAQDACDRYIVAARTDPSAREHARMLDDLLELTRREDTGDQAAAAVVRIYGAGALPAVDALLASGELRWNAERRLRRLRQALAS